MDKTLQGAAPAELKTAYDEAAATATRFVAGFLNHYLENDLPVRSMGRPDWRTRAANITP